MKKYFEAPNKTFTAMVEITSSVINRIPPGKHESTEDYPNLCLHTGDGYGISIIIHKGTGFNYTLRDKNPSAMLVEAFDKDIVSFGAWLSKSYGAVPIFAWVKSGVWCAISPRDRADYIPNGIQTRAVKAKSDKSQILTLTVHLPHSLVFTAKTKMKEDYRQYGIIVNGVQMWGYLLSSNITIKPSMYFNNEYLCDLIKQTTKDVLPVLNQVEVFEV